MKHFLRWWKALDVIDVFNPSIYSLGVHFGGLRIRIPEFPFSRALRAKSPSVYCQFLLRTVT